MLLLLAPLLFFPSPSAGALEPPALVRAKGGNSTSYDEDMAIYLAAMSGAAYCANKRKNGVIDWGCNICKHYPDIVNTTVIDAKDTAFTGAAAFVGYDAKAKTMILAVAGTDPLKITNWIDDANFFLQATDRCPGCQVDRGFDHTYNSLATHLEQVVKDYHAIYPIERRLVTGHSLGATTALLAALDLEDWGFPCDWIYTMGEPRIGNQMFADYISAKLEGRHYRLTHHRDPVPHLAPEALGYRHPGREVWYPKDPLGTYTVCDGSGEDIHCSDSLTVDVWLPDHWFYAGADYLSTYLGCKI